ncbi:MAG: hypothetical protein NTW19_21145 [Planctomycetota bacterium]|nr:hypothetical protein [Planctomycetota bacterium]
MPDRPLQPAFPLGPAVLTLSALALPVSAVALLAVSAIRPELFPPVAAGLAVSWLSSILGFLPMALWSSGGAKATQAAFLAGSALRMGLCFAGLLTIHATGIAVLPAALAIVALYFPLLALDTKIVSNHLKSMDHQPAGNPASAGPVTESLA